MTVRFKLYLSLLSLAELTNLYLLALHPFAFGVQDFFIQTFSFKLKVVRAIFKRLKQFLNLLVATLPQVAF